MGRFRKLRRVGPTLALALALLPSHAAGQDGGSTEPASPPPLRVLFVGNSLTIFNHLPGMVTAVSRLTGGRAIDAESVSRPGTGLEDHWGLPETREALQRGGWDVVVLQQGPSATEGRPSLLEYGRRFAGEIRRAGAEPAFYMVWPSRARFGDFDGVSLSYRTAAESTGATLLAAGDAWRRAWALDPDLELYGGDGFHPSPLGSLLAALVIVRGITGRLPASLPGRLTLATGASLEVPEETAGLLLRAAGRRFHQSGPTSPADP